MHRAEPGEHLLGDLLLPLIARLVAEVHPTPKRLDLVDRAERAGLERAAAAGPGARDHLDRRPTGSLEPDPRVRRFEPRDVQPVAPCVEVAAATRRAADRPPQCGPHAQIGVDRLELVQGWPLGGGIEPRPHGPSVLRGGGWDSRGHATLQATRGRSGESSPTGCIAASPGPQLNSPRQTRSRSW